MTIQRVGDDNAGFSIDVSPGGLRVTGWGFWDVELSATFGTAVLDACRSQPRGLSVVLDMTDLKPMREQGQSSFTQLLRALPSLGVEQTSIVTANALTKLQLVRLAAESGVRERVEWIAGAPSQGRRD